jgi:hypothetical protein
MNAMTTPTFPSKAAQAGSIVLPSQGAVDRSLTGRDHALAVRCMR